MLKFQKKTPPPIFAFRLDSKDKTWLEQELAALHEGVNKRRKADEKAISKSAIILEALRIGLSSIKKKYR